MTELGETLLKTDTIPVKATITPELSLRSKLGGVTVSEYGREAMADGNPKRR